MIVPARPFQMGQTDVMRAAGEGAVKGSALVCPVSTIRWRRRCRAPIKSLSDEVLT
jgi:hypothetical protein